MLWMAREYGARTSVSVSPPVQTNGMDNSGAVHAGVLPNSDILCTI